MHPAPNCVAGMLHPDPGHDGIDTVTNPFYRFSPRRRFLGSAFRRQHLSAHTRMRRMNSTTNPRIDDDFYDVPFASEDVQHYHHYQHCPHSFSEGKKTKDTVYGDAPNGGN